MDSFDLFQNLDKPISPAIKEMIDNSKRSVEVLGDMLSKASSYSNELKPLYEEIIRIIRQVSVPGYSEQKINELIDSHKKWGSYGWTHNSETNLSFFSSPPLSLEDSNRIMQSYCTEENIRTIKKDLSEATIDSLDLEEAYSSFFEGKYKSCALILFSLLDHELISKNYRQFEKNSLGKRKIGRQAAIALKDDKAELFQKRFLIERLLFTNILSAIIALFEKYHDFENEPDFINRNFVSHGMSKRRVTALDCFRIWSALYSLVILFPELEELKY